VKYLSACLLLFALAGCAEHHDLTACQGPYTSIGAPVSPPAPPARQTMLMP
jgi:hypothetical protein